MAVVILTTGVPGSGKTYIRASRFPVDDFLINTKGQFITNFPLYKDVIAEEVSRRINSSIGFWGLKRKKVTPEEVAARIEIIPTDVLLRWRDGKSGPWEYFKDRDLKFSHIAIDEIHNFVRNEGMSKDTLKQWDDFLGEVRHRGCTFECITQHLSQLHKCVLGRAAIWLHIVPAEDLRDPYFHVLYMDWYELMGCLTGHFHKTSFQIEKRRYFNSWIVNHSKRFWLTEEYFKYYDSYNVSLQQQAEGTAEDTAEGAETSVPDIKERTVPYEYQQRSKPSLILWFLRRNAFTLSWRLIVAGIVMWLCFFGGLNFLIMRWLDMTQLMVHSNTPSSVVKKGQKVTGQGEQIVQDEDFEEIKDEKTGKLVRRKKKQDEGLEPYKPAMFFEGRCWLRNGMRIEQGFEFKKREVKVLNGRTVKKVDSVERTYVLDDDYTVYMF